MQEVLVTDTNISNTSNGNNKNIQSLVDEFITALNTKTQNGSNDSQSSAQITSNLQQLVDRIYTDAAVPMLSSDDNTIEELLSSSMADTNISSSQQAIKPPHPPLQNPFFQTRTTKPESFQFHLDKRKTESKQDDLSLRIQNEEMANCTFHPEIHELPAQYSKKRHSFIEEKPFVERAMKWKEKQDKERQKKVDETKQKALEDCTFKPAINTSLPAASFQDVEVYDKLYHNASLRQKKMEAERQRSEEERMQECTFKPSIKSSTPVPSRYLQPTKSLENKLDPSREPAAECTFTPQINPLNKKFSNGSILYLSTNAFERLSKPKSPPPSSQDASTILSPSLLNVSNVSSSSTISFQAFLERQQSREQIKQEKLQQIQHAMEASHKPKINTKSKELLSAKQFSFLERVNNYQQRQKHQQQQQTRTKESKECTFQPKINKASKHLKARTYEQLEAEYMNKQEKH